MIIEFPPPRTVLLASDLRVTSIVEVGDALAFSEQHRGAQACFRLEQLDQGTSAADAAAVTAAATSVAAEGTIPPRSATRPRPFVSFCEDLEVSVLRFKGLTNGTYNLSLWMESGGHDNSGVPSGTLISYVSSRIFQVVRGAEHEGWLVDPRLRLARPAVGPTTPHSLRRWPCLASSSSSSSSCSTATPHHDNFNHGQTNEYGEPVGLPTVHAAVPWSGTHQLLLPIPTLVSSLAIAREQSGRGPAFAAFTWQQERASGTGVILVVGIKVAAKDFAYRSAIRETWMRHRLAATDTRIWFIVGTPAASTTHALLDELQAEAVAYQDMLLGPHPRLLESRAGPYPWTVFNVSDSYYTLVQKTVTFMEFALRTYPNFGFLMILDNDVYLRLDMLMEVLRALDMRNRTRFFAGQVWQSQYGRPLRPQRDPDLKNYLPWRLWPLRDLPPLAIGPHYLMSRDCAEFIAMNKETLRGIGTLEDVSVSVWLRGYGVSPEHVRWFNNAKNFGCVEGLVSLSDLSPEAIRKIHSNLADGRPFCHGMEGIELDAPGLGIGKAWKKQNESSMV